MKSLLKFFYTQNKRLPWFHPESTEFWSLLREVHYANEGVELVFEGVLTEDSLHFLYRLLTGEQQSQWRRHDKAQNSSLNRHSDLPWYHPKNCYFWRQVSDVRISAHTTVLVFLGSALHDDFRLWLRQRQSTIRTPGSDFLLTSRDLADWRDKCYSPQDEAEMFNFWARYHPEIVDQADWRGYICEQARIETEFAHNRLQLQKSINQAFLAT